MIEPSSTDEALLDQSWIQSMEEELRYFSINNVWDLLPRPKGTHVIRTKWVFRNKLNEKGKVVRNQLEWLHKDIVSKKE